MTIYIVDIEAVDTRYTSQWKEHLPKQLQKHFAFNGVDEVVTISGGEAPQATTPGAFLNFGGTNVYKSNQLEQIGEMFCNGTIKDGDYFLYTDAWNPTVIQLKYMASLLKVNIKIGGMWHAGSYDPADFLGRLIGDKPWVRNAEQSMFDCYDDNFYASKFHVKLFLQTFPEADESKIKIVGWPMEYLEETLKPYAGAPKYNNILFPHRVAPEKQPEIFTDLANSMPEYNWIIAQEKELSKDEYHKLLATSKLVFSANLQETLGISWYEGALVGTLPMVPDRLSYSEMATPDVLYPSEWTSSWDNYLKHKEKIMEHINKIMNLKDYDSVCKQLTKKVSPFFDGKRLYEATETF
jgi:glycosyltransferase involved in cell wall biosynthesis